MNVRAWRIKAGTDPARCEGFQWDAGNTRKSVSKHGVRQAEAGQILFNGPLLLLPDVSHRQIEARFYALGHTGDGRQLHLTFTLRVQGQLIRIISARDMHRTERHSMGRTLKPIPTFDNEAEERQF